MLIFLSSVSSAAILNSARCTYQLKYGASEAGYMTTLLDPVDFIVANMRTALCRYSRTRPSIWWGPSSRSIPSRSALAPCFFLLPPSRDFSP
ncbi:hypothetical protein BOTBODRAFT_223209 [Botryobasidium botryosum FD-172 SS1]|uniref:Uncharacterized protein n=1 Tax=Botryobasidium botryosum (strain FD-172 SS1) TaxID=930990 RepID=A0A067MYN9_BOTB1|nr:hypothetical protein BOTBODRAFT_223209 [Botryobasidium botryosum FD-172 SS1]